VPGASATQFRAFVLKPAAAELPTMLARAVVSSRARALPTTHKREAGARKLFVMKTFAARERAGSMAPWHR